MRRASKESAKGKARKNKRVTPGNFPIVGLGASAGGLEAVTQVLSHLPVREPILVLDGEFKVIAANGPFYRIFGLLPEHTENRPLFELRDWNIPELRALLSEQPGKGFMQGLEVDRSFSALGQKTLAINTRRVPAHGKPRMFLVAIEDISARRAAEEALRDSQETLSALTRQTPIGILRNDVAGECISANAEACRIAGVTPEEALGEGWTRHVHPDDLLLLRATTQNTLRDGEGFSVEFRFLFPDGRVVWAYQVSIRLRDPGGATSGYLSGITDITKRKNLEDQLRQSQKMEAIGRLAGGVAHDFNNMLTAISGYASQLLAAMPESDAARKAAEQISKVGEQAAMLTRQLLALSRKQLLRPRPVNLNQVLRDMNDLLLRLLGETIEVVLALEPDVGNVMVDPGQIQQVILNLAINARDAMALGGRLTLTTASVSVNEAGAERDGMPPGDYVRLTVSDPGVGMDRATRIRLFEPFFTTKPSGTGLGLSLVNDIVRQSGGTIDVTSELGKGTTVHIYLPRAEGGIEPVRDQTRGAAPEGTETVLLVEDAAVVRSLVRELLQQSGYTVLEARDGVEALSISESHVGPIHLLLTDLLMPRMSGHELVKHIRRRRHDIEVIYMSGYSGDAVLAVDKEANFLEKPFKPEGLAAAVRKALDKKRLATPNHSRPAKNRGRFANL